MDEWIANWKNSVNFYSSKQINVMTFIYFVISYILLFSFLVITSSATVELDDVNDFRAFTSPNWPNNYPNDAYRRFTIYSPVGTAVKLEVLDLQLEGYDCNTDPIIIYDGE